MPQQYIFIIYPIAEHSDEPAGKYQKDECGKSGGCRSWGKKREVRWGGSTEAVWGPWAEQ